LADFVKINAACIWEKQQGEEKIQLFFRHAQFLFLRYHPEPLACPAVVYWAEGTTDERFDFDSLLQGPWEQHVRPGNHLTILGEPNVESLARHLRIRIEEVARVGEQSADA
jgi:thioesterase domain-containing protein